MASEPEGMTGTSQSSSSPSDMMAPLPNCFSMDPTTVLMVRSFSAISRFMMDTPVLSARRPRAARA